MRIWKQHLSWSEVAIMVIVLAVFFSIDRGRVVRVTRDGCQVQVSGEIWEADSAPQLAVGDPVRVESVDGLVLKVQKLQGMTALTRDQGRATSRSAV